MGTSQKPAFPYLMKVIKSIFIIFLDKHGVVDSEFVLQALTFIAVLL